MYQNQYLLLWLNSPHWSTDQVVKTVKRYKFFDRVTYQLAMRYTLKIFYQLI